MQDKRQFGDMLKDEKRKSQFNINCENLCMSMQCPYLWVTST